MNVGQLKAILADKDDDAPVMVRCFVHGEDSVTQPLKVVKSFAGHNRIYLEGNGNG